jgi:colicin import membrane protein
MNSFQPDHRPVQAPQRGCLSLVLTIVVHIGLIALLFFGFTWQNEPLGSLEVGLVGAPSAPGPASAPPPPPPPPKVETPPPPPEPPAPEPPKEPPPAPEIATKKEPEKKPEKKPDPPKPDPPKQEKKPEPKKPEQPLKPIDIQKLTNQKLEQELARAAEEKKANEIMGGGGQQGQSRQPAGNPGNPGELDAYRAAITKKVYENLVTPPGLSGKPKAVFEIEQVMGSRGGEVINVRIKQSSGNRVLDEALERAIRNSDPLPPPNNPALFRRKLEVTFYPLGE